MTRRWRRASVIVGATCVVLLVSGCQKDTPLSEAAVRAGTPGAVASGIALAVEGPTCSPLADQQLCSVGVWYVNTTDASVEIDATKLLVRDSAGAYRSGTVDAEASSLAIDAHGRQLVLWGVVLPVDLQPVGVVWTAADGSLASADVGGAVSPSATPSESSTPSASAPVTETPTPTVSATPTTTPTPIPPPTPTPKPTPKPKPTKPKPSPSATTPIGSIG
jgi:hypothetical protein